LDYGGHDIELPHDFDLQFAIKAEVIIEKILSHAGTRGLSININNMGWLLIPESDNIPYPQWDYHHHTYPVIEIPLSYLIDGYGNRFRMKVSPEHPWNWPQNLINGVHFRVYYNPVKKAHPQGILTSPYSGSSLGTTVPIQVDAGDSLAGIKKVEFIGFMEDIDYNGDMRYRQWHYHFYHGDIKHHLGTDNTAPYELSWNTSWIPDQTDPVKLAARIHNNNDIIYFTEPAAGLTFDRPGIAVELCKPYDIPREWVTRIGEKSAKFDIQGDLSRLIAARLVWSSWSPGYMNGVFINNVQVFDHEGPKYRYYFHSVNIQNLPVFNSGMNSLKTGKTPKINGQTVHGTEINAPGIMVLLQYETDASTGIRNDHSDEHEPALSQNFPNPFNATTSIKYSLPHSGQVTLAIYNIRGQKIATLVDEFQSEGDYQTIWHGDMFPGGLYFYQLTAGNYSEIRKLILQK
jgi:hypothetical protein